ncbi:MAG: NUDIX domain-containing protein [Gammaproteobacteria bacterium]|nr:NUDIX domain-containing protein [Gammaproteobacteria bacterium]MCP5424305.1 NUDIX domain-containing protein [Gammaproteobacteria bacterium]MCP5459058.1 NUDIX domain-containing protein [Gammaproteobacteria bacterium]
MQYEFKVLNRTVAYEGFFKLEVYQVQHELFAGGESPVVVRECLERGHAVAVLPYDPVRDQVVLIEQFRIGAMNSPVGPWLLEIVAGMIKLGESPLQVAHREVVEEIGQAVQDVVPICQYLLSPGGASETITLFCGRVDASQISELHGLAEEHEDIRAHVMTRSAALELLHSGRIASATPIIALQWLELNHRKLMGLWGTNG